MTSGGEHRKSATAADYAVGVAEELARGDEAFALRLVR